MYQSIFNLIKKLRAFNGSAEESLALLRKNVGPGVRVINEPISDQFRVFLTPHKGLRTPTGIAAICGGIVLEYPAWDILSLPPPPAVDKYSRDFVVTNFANYTVEYAMDGTLTTLYWYENKWCASTLHGYDVSGLKWMGGKTYMEAMHDVLGADFWDNLSKEHSHTIVFRSADFHPLEAEVARATSIVSVDLGDANNNFKYTEAETPLPRPALYPLLGMKTAADHYTSLVNSNRQALSGLIRLGTTPRFGFILRPKKVGLPIILMRSDLAAFLRDTLYSVPECAALTAENRMNFMILRAWLSYNCRFILANLLPKRTQTLYRSYGLLLRRIASHIITPDDQESGPEVILARAIGAKMRAEGVEFSPVDAGAESQVLDYLTNVDFAEKYLPLL